MIKNPSTLKRTISEIQPFPAHLKAVDGAVVPRESYLKHRLASFFENKPVLKPYQGNDTHEQCPPWTCHCSQEQLTRYQEYNSLKQLPVFCDQCEYIDNMNNGHLKHPNYLDVMRSIVITEGAVEKTQSNRFIAAIQFEIQLDKRRLSIHMLGVNALYQRKGLGHQLLSAALLIGLEYGCHKVSLGSTLEGLEFYKTFGFFHKNFEDSHPVTDTQSLIARLNANIESGDYGLNMELHLQKHEYQSSLNSFEQALQRYQPTFKPLEYLSQRTAECKNLAIDDIETEVKRQKKGSKNKLPRHQTSLKH